LVAGTAAVWEAHRPVLERVDVRLRRLPAAFEGFTIAQLTDIHFDDWLHASYYHDVVARVNDLRPDLIALTGDYISAPLRSGFGSDVATRHAPPCAAVLSALRAQHGVFAVLGNHDVVASETIVSAALRAQGIPVLINEYRAVERSGARVWLCGVNSMFSRKYRPKAVLQSVPVDDCKIVLLHEPDGADDVAPAGGDFMMAGHSHGGQVRLPLLPPLFLPPRARKYPIGLRTVAGMPLYTSRGIGVIHLPFRFLCPPEITLFTLRRG
jgi:predicted MPP superfamily phosphohydrolase